MEGPTWDDEPQAQVPAPSTDAWETPATEPEPEPDSELVETTAEPVAEAPLPAPEQASVPSAFPAQLGLQQQKPASPVVPPAKPVTPVSYARSLTRPGNRFKATDQPVVMPSTFGSSVEKLGMQFGSVGLSDDTPETKV